MAARVSGWCAAACVLVLALGGRAWAYHYQTCFAFDPVFVQADQRRAPVPATPSSQASRHASGQDRDEVVTRAPRMTLTTLSRALKELLGTTETTDESKSSKGKKGR